MTNSRGGARAQSTRGRGRPAALARILAAGVLLAGPGGAAPPATGGVRFGDAVPAIVKPSDLERIRRELNLKRFSVIAAVLLGATEGRELLVAEPLPDAALGRIVEACEAGGFCPDPVGFLAGRVRIVLLRGTAVDTVLVADDAIRDRTGPLFDLADYGTPGNPIGWSGRAEEAGGHVAVALTPITVDGDGRPGAGADPPFNIRWDDRTRRFGLYECRFTEDGTTACAFEERFPD